jgi:transcriptional/translational regulatory protein YebC/TACO1
VSWQFQRAAYFAFPAAGLDQDEIFDLACDGGADDIILGEDDIEIFAPVGSFKTLNDSLVLAGVHPDEARLRMIPNTMAQLAPEQSIKVMRIIEEIEDLEDVQDVYSNLDVTEEAVALLEAA